MVPPTEADVRLSLQRTAKDGETALRHPPYPRMRKTLPSKLVLPGGEVIPIKEHEHLGKRGTLGYYDEKKFEIVIKRNQSETSKNIILVHEIIHVIETAFLNEGMIKKRINHEFITNLAGLLVSILVLSNLWKPKITKEEMLELIALENK